MRKSLLLASLAVISASVLGMSEKRGLPSDGFENNRQLKQMKISDPRDEASSSSSQTPNVQNVQNYQDVKALSRYLFDLVRERESANETEKDAITERIRETGISEDIENNIVYEIEDGIRLEITNMNDLRAEGVSQEKIRKLKKRAGEIAKERAIEKVCNLIRIQANIAPKVVDWRENNSILHGLNNIMKERAHNILNDFLFDEGFSVIYQTMNFNNRVGLVGYTVAHQGKQKANVLRVIVRNYDEFPEMVRSRIAVQDGDYDIVVPQFKNGQIVDEIYRVISKDGQIKYDSLKFLHQSGIALSKNDLNLKNLLLTVLHQIQNEPIIKGSRELEQIQRQNAFLVSFIIQGIEEGIINFFSDESENRLALLTDNSDIDCSLFGLTLNNNKQDAAQLRKQNELLNSIIKNNIRKLSMINCTIDKVSDEIFGLRGIYFLDSTITPDDIPTIPQEAEMVQVLEQHENGNLTIRYTESAINQERKGRIRQTKKELRIIEDGLYRSSIVAYLSYYKNQFVMSKSDLEEIVNRNQKEELEKTWQLKNLLCSLQAIDDETKNLNLDGLISRIRDQQSRNPLLRWRDGLAEQNSLANMINNFDFDNLGNNSTGDSDPEISSSDSGDLLDDFDPQQGVNQ